MIAPEVSSLAKKRSSSLVYIETKQHDAALQDLKRALEINPEDPVAYGNRAVVFYREGDHERAYADSEKAIAYGINDLIQRGMVEYGLYMLRVAINFSRRRYEQVIADHLPRTRYRAQRATISSSPMAWYGKPREAHSVSFFRPSRLWSRCIGVVDTGK